MFILWVIVVFFVAVAFMLTMIAWPLTGRLMDIEDIVDYISKPIDYVATKAGML